MPVPAGYCDRNGFCNAGFRPGHRLRRRYGGEQLGWIRPGRRHGHGPRYHAGNADRSPGPLQAGWHSARRPGAAPLQAKLRRRSGDRRSNPSGADHHCEREPAPRILRNGGIRGHRRGVQTTDGTNVDRAAEVIRHDGVPRFGLPLPGGCRQRGGVHLESFGRNDRGRKVRRHSGFERPLCHNHPERCQHPLRGSLPPIRIAGFIPVAGD